MNKVIIKLMIMVCCSFPCLHATEVFTKAKVGYFYSTDQNFRDIYSNAGVYSLEAHIPISKQFVPWLSVGWLYTTGASLELKKETELYAIPLGVGVTYLIGTHCIQPYLGLGMTATYVHIHNDYPFVTSNQSGYGLGGVAKTGVLAHLGKGFFFDLFFDYSYLKMKVSHADKNLIKGRVNLSGLSAGAGIGYRF